MELGKICPRSLRELWDRETKFSDWLAEEGLPMIGDAIGIELCEAKREVSVGGYSADILAREDGGNRTVVIENQYSSANHDHLGKLITYAAGLEAEIIVWIVENEREEAISAVKWLNKISRERLSFFLIKAEVLQIDNSALAPRFSVIEKPDEWSRQTQLKAGELGERQELCLQFWTEFAAYASADPIFSKAFNPRKPSTDHWLNYFIGSSSYHISLTIKGAKGRNTVAVEIYIPDDKEQYARFAEAREMIEKELGFKMDWQPLPGKKAARIYYGIEMNWVNKIHREKCFRWMAEKAVSIKKVFAKYR